jgi:ribosomal protein L29
MLVQALAALGVVDYSATINNLNQIQQSTAQSFEKVKEMQDNGTIKLDYDISDTGLSLEELEAQIAQLKQERARLSGPEGPGVGSTEVTALDNVIASQESVLKIRTEVEGAEDAKAKIEELKSMTDEEIAKTFDIDINTDEGKQKLQELKSEIAGLSSSDYAATVKIDAG